MQQYIQLKSEVHKDQIIKIFFIFFFNFMLTNYSYIAILYRTVWLLLSSNNDQVYSGNLLERSQPISMSLLKYPEAQAYKAVRRLLAILLFSNQQVCSLIM